MSQKKLLQEYLSRISSVAPDAKVCEKDGSWIITLGSSIPHSRPQTVERGAVTMEQNKTSSMFLNIANVFQEMYDSYEASAKKFSQTSLEASKTEMQQVQKEMREAVQKSLEEIKASAKQYVHKDEFFKMSDELVKKMDVFTLTASKLQDEHKRDLDAFQAKVLGVFGKIGGLFSEVQNKT
jgi:hypothetical protein